MNKVIKSFYKYGFQYDKGENISCISNNEERYIGIAALIVNCHICLYTCYLLCILEGYARHFTGDAASFSYIVQNMTAEREFGTW